MHIGSNTTRKHSTATRALPRFALIVGVLSQQPVLRNKIIVSLNVGLRMPKRGRIIGQPHEKLWM